MRVTDYDGDNRKAYGSFSSGETVIYALVPLIPQEFHSYLIDFGLAYLAMSGYYEGDWEKMRSKVYDSLMVVLKLRGVLE